MASSLGRSSFGETVLLNLGGLGYLCHLRRVFSPVVVLGRVALQYCHLHRGSFIVLLAFAEYCRLRALVVWFLVYSVPCISELVM